MIPPAKASCTFSLGKSLSGVLEAAASETMIGDREARSKINSKIAQTIRMHIATTAPNLSSLKPFVSQASDPANLTKRRIPHAIENKNKIKSKNIPISFGNQAHLTQISRSHYIALRRTFLLSLYFGFFLDPLLKTLAKLRLLTSKVGLGWLDRPITRTFDEQKHSRIAGS